MAREHYRVDVTEGTQDLVPFTPAEETQADTEAIETEEERIARQRSEAEHVQVANLNETDWILAPPADTPQSILNQIANNLPGWQAFRDGLNALPILTIPDPTQLVWPTHPVRPGTALTPPPSFLLGP